MSPTLAQVCSLALAAQRTCAVAIKNKTAAIRMSMTTDSNKSQSRTELKKPIIPNRVLVNSSPSQL